MDFLKLQTFDLKLIDYFSKSEKLTWLSETDKLNRFDNEVITTKKVKQYRGIYFCFYANRLDILFKPHYYFNDNLHNANDFKIIDCINVINEFKNDLNIDLNLLKVVNIEFGLNVISPINIKHLITYLAYHDKNEFRSDVGLAYSKKSYSVHKNGTANKYKFIKAYAKGLQFPEYCDINTFRFEVSSKMNKYCRSELNVTTADDLLNVKVYHRMIEVLIKEFKEVLILDCYTNFDNLNPKELKKLKEYLNPLVWYNIKEQNRNSFSKNKTNYYKLIDKVENHLKNQLEKIIFNKLQFLKEGAYSTPNKNIEKGAYSTFTYSGICTPKNKVCPITGKDISEQKNVSLMLSLSGLRYLYKNDIKTFEMLKNKYLSKYWITADLEKQIEQIAHGIRLKKSNATAKHKRIYQPEQLNFLSQF